MANIHSIACPLRRCCQAAVLFVSFIMVGFWAVPANGYVLKGPHILDLMVRKISGAKTLQVDQSVVIEDPAISGQPVEILETLRFIFPNRFRSDMRYENTHRFYVFSQGEALTVVDGTIRSDRSARFNRYKDLFLYNSRHALHKALSVNGVDVGVTSLGHMKGRPVFVIGANYPDDSVSQVWVDKERFVPLRWINVIPPRSAGMQPERLDFVYRNWQEVDGVWYPRQIDTFHNHAPIRQIRVSKVNVNVAISADLLNIPHLKTVHKQKEISTPENDGAPDTDVDEVQRTLEDFRKKFDP